MEAFIVHKHVIQWVQKLPNDSRAPAVQGYSQLDDRIDPRLDPLHRVSIA